MHPQLWQLNKPLELGLSGKLIAMFLSMFVMLNLYNTDNYIAYCTGEISASEVGSYKETLDQALDGIGDQNLSDIPLPALQGVLDIFINNMDVIDSRATQSGYHNESTRNIFLQTSIQNQPYLQNVLDNINQSSADVVENPEFLTQQYINWYNTIVKVSNYCPLDEPNLTTDQNTELDRSFYKRRFLIGADIHSYVKFSNFNHANIVQEATENTGITPQLEELENARYILSKELEEKLLEQRIYLKTKVTLDQSDISYSDEEN